MGEKGNILIVDDNVSLCQTMGMILKHKGYTVTITNSGEEAITKVKERPYDMIFLDIKMPGMNGVETFRRIKEIRPDAIVEMMTAYAVDDLVHKVLQDGAHGVLYKPLDVDETLAHIERAIGSKNEKLIMVVDDDPGTCKTLKLVLTRRGFKVSIAHSGEEAVTIAQEKPYAIILIDMKMPTMNGLDTYLAIKKVNPEAVAIMMTGYYKEEATLVKKALDMTAYACLYKPFDMAEMLRLMDEILELKKVKA